MDAYIWPIVAGLAFAAPLIYAVAKFGFRPVRDALGLFKINDFIVEKIRQGIIADCRKLKVGGLSEDDATSLIREAARHSIARTFASVYPQRKFEVTNTWPDATVIISGNIAVLKIWIGHDYADDGEGIKAINLEVDRAPALKLDTRKTIAKALEESHGLPSVRSDERKSVANSRVETTASINRVEPPKIRPEPPKRVRKP